MALVAALASVSACSDEVGLVVHFSDSDISMAAAQGAAPDEDGTSVLVAYLTGDLPPEGIDIYARAELRGEGLRPEIPTTVNVEARSAGFSLRPDTSLALGVRSGTLTLMACTDPACQAQLEGSPHEVSYRVELFPRLQISTESVHLHATAGTLSSSAKVQFSMPVTTTVEYRASGRPDWLDVSIAGNMVSVTADARMLSTTVATTENATLILHATNPTQTRRVAVELSLLPMAPPGP